MKRTLALVAAVALMLSGANLAHAAAPGCPSGRMCLHDTSTQAPFFEVDAADTTLNRCIFGFSAATSYITNRTGYRWIVSTSTNCAANRGIIYPNSQGAMIAPWNNNIRGMYRTSSTSLAN